MAINIFLDVIGIKKLLATDKPGAVKKLNDFWDRVNTFQINGFPPQCNALRPNGFGGMQSVISKPRLKYYTFSDSAFFNFEEEVPDDYITNTFLPTLRHLLRDFDYYIIASKGEEIKVKNPYPFGGWVCSSGDNRPDYTHMVGSGEAWINIFEIEEYIKAHKDLHKKYNSYTIGFVNPGQDWELIDKAKLLFGKKI